MLPDLRIVIAAVISTFVLTVGVGFYASSRLISEPKRSADSLAAFEETPVNRIALSWPEPTRQSEPLALDFAVTAKALRNPVRDVTNEAAPAEQPQQPIRTTATDLAAPSSEKTTQTSSAQTEAAPARMETIPAPAVTDAPKPAPEPEIRVAVEYPPVLELPPELLPPSVPVAPSAAAAPPSADAPATTGSVTEQPKAAEPPSPVTVQPDLRIANRPEQTDVNSDNPDLDQVPTPKPAPKLKAKKAAPKKAAAKRPKPPLRRVVRPAIPAVNTTFPWNFFGTTLPN